MWWTFQHSTGMTTNIHRIFAEWLICATAVACCLRVHTCMCMLLLNKLIIHRPVLDCAWGQITAGLWAFTRQTREPPPQRLKEKALHCSRWQHLHLFKHSVMTQQQTRQETRQRGGGGGSRGAYLGANCYIVVDTAVKKRQRVRGSQGKLKHRMSLTEVSKKKKKGDDVEDCAGAGGQKPREAEQRSARDQWLSGLVCPADGTSLFSTCLPQCAPHLFHKNLTATSSVFHTRSKRW